LNDYLTSSFIVVVMVVVMLYPLPFIVNLPILFTIGAFPLPVLAALHPSSFMALIKLVVPLLGIHSVMMFCEGFAGVLAIRTIVVGAAAAVVLGQRIAHLS
jgi:hypothetical protein